MIKRQCKTCSFVQKEYSKGDKYIGSLADIYSLQQEGERSSDGHTCRLSPPAFTSDQLGFDVPYVDGENGWCSHYMEGPDGARGS